MLIIERYPRISAIQVSIRRLSVITILVLLTYTTSRPLFAQSLKLRSFSRIGGDFALTDIHGNEKRLSDFNDRVVVLYFGYTLCPDICPNTLFVMADVLNMLGDRAGEVQLLYITLDPERDTAQRLQEYLSMFDQRILGLRGSKEATAEIAKKYVIRYRKQFIGSSDAYVINHTSYAFLVDRRGTVRCLFPYKTTAGAIAQTIGVLLDESPGD